MAATGFTPVYLYASGTTGHIPLAANLTNTTNGSEIALNYADGNLFFKNASNSVITTPLLQSSGSQSGWLSSTDWTTFNAKQTALVSGTNIKTVSGTSLLGSGDLGTIGTGYGGTGLTSFTANAVLYSTSTSALTTGTALYFDGTYLGVGNNTPGSFFAGANRVVIGNGSGNQGATIYSGAAATGFLCFGKGTSGDSPYRGWVAYSHDVDALTFAASASEFMRGFGSGGVSIGNTTDPGATNLYVTGRILSGTSSTYSNSQLIVYGAATGTNQRVAVIASSTTGDVGNNALYISKYDNNVTTSQKFVAFDVNNGNTGCGGIQGNGSNGPQFYNTSDIFLKENIRNMPNQLQNILNLKPRLFDFIDGPKDCDGFIAQEFEQVYPDAISKDDKGYKTIGGVSVMSARLIKAMQELYSEIENLKTLIGSK